MLIFVSSNQHKIQRIQPTLKQFGVQIQIKSLDLHEIQSSSIEEIVVQKAKDAFSKLGTPLFVVDDGWFITALNGFPGAYMKEVNEWFTSEDFLKLMEYKENREVYIEQWVCFTDGETVKTFCYKQSGKVLNEIRGNGLPSNNVFSMIDGISISEGREQDIRMLHDISFWKEFADWLKANNKI